MNQRRRLQVLHERFNVNLFLKEFNARYHADFKVIGEPNPPEAIIQSKNTTRWVEVTTAYLSKEYAVDLHTDAVKNEKHQPRSKDVSFEPNVSFAKQFVSVVTKKLEKSTYEPFFKKHGKGYLVVSIQNPLFDQRTLATTLDIWNKSQVSDQGFFKSIYIVYPVFDHYKVSLWKSNLA